MKMEIGDRLQFWRNKKGISVYRLSELCGVSDTHLHTLERGGKQPTIKTLEAITDALGITLSEFFNTEDNKVTYLSEGEKRILDFYRSMPPDKADILIEFYEKMCSQ